MVAGGVSRAGFIGLAGRPNVGKSTLANAIVGTKVAIVSDRPQTTRRAIRAVATAPDQSWQAILIDLPGVQKPRDALTERMQTRVESELAEADAVLMVINGEQGVGPGDRFIGTTLLSAATKVPVICAVNKIDRLNKPQTVEVLAAAAELEAVDEVFPISARRGDGVDALLERLAELMPEGPLLYPPEDRSDQASDVHLAELIREQVLKRTREEIPHAVEVEVVEISEREDGLTDVRADVWAESESQKAILIGKGGSMIHAIGTAARKELERDLGVRVFLDLQVKVRDRWRRDESLLDRLGID
jgi:GTPase